jgi:hypothetical protein
MGKYSIWNTGHGEVKWRLQDGFLEIELEEWRSRQLIDTLSEEIRRNARQENATPGDFKKIHRLSRICYELALENRITMIDYNDGKILYDIPFDINSNWLIEIFNGVRSILPNTEASIVMADHFAKSVEIIHSS